MQAIENIGNVGSESGKGFDPTQLRALRREVRRVHAGARASVARLNALAARVEGDIDAILRGGAMAHPS
jgi:hypothetical protein